MDPSGSTSLKYIDTYIGRKTVHNIRISPLNVPACLKRRYVDPDPYHIRIRITGLKILYSNPSLHSTVRTDVRNYSPPPIFMFHD